MTKLDLDAIAGRAREAKERADKATPLPWLEGQRKLRNKPPVNDHPGCSSVAMTAPGQGVFTAHAGGIYPANDAKFIAAARTDVPALAADVRALVEHIRIQDRQLSAYRMLDVSQQMIISSQSKKIGDEFMVDAAARETLESERDANAWLTAENAALVERVRELESRGPVMPETPSLCILASMCAAGWGDHWIGTERQEAVYRAIRAALMEEDAVTKT